MSGYGLEIDQLRRAAAAARSAGEALAALEVGCRLGGAVGSLPGARSGESLRQLQDSWVLQGRNTASASPATTPS